MKRDKLRKILMKSQPTFWHYVKKTETQAKDGFHIKQKRVYFQLHYTV